MTPTTLKRSWFPAAVVLPTAETWHNVKVLAADTGLLIFKAIPADGETPDWQSPIDYGTEPEPAQSARNGITITTEAGPVGITSSGGCGCGNALKRWKPAGMTQVSRWRTAVTV